jgi:hypothetical protein
VQKPFTVFALTGAIRRTLERPEPARYALSPS